jgi:glutathione synthase/RimK-type ligase-like ATP-grasp enzyme
MNKKIKAIILGNEREEDHQLWIKACRDHEDKLEYSAINLTAENWLEALQQSESDILLAKPGGLTAPFKQLYDERIYILAHELGYKIYPSPEEIYIYENKRFFSYWLKANNIPHPETHIYYTLHEALTFSENCKLPVVAKTNIGASGSGVIVLHSKTEVGKYIDQAFSAKGAPKRTGPNLAAGGLLKRGFHYILNPGDISMKLKIYKANRADLQTGFAIFQEYIPHDFEWRVVRIGDSFFAHKKMKLGEKTSGSLIKGYENPPLRLLDFVKDITDKHRFYSQAVDLFEDIKKGYLVNEMQCMFGQSDPYQMLVDGRPGRYRFIENKWVFEEGMFNNNESFNTRIEYVLSLFR